MHAVAEREDRHLVALEQLLDVERLAERLRSAQAGVELDLRPADPDALARGEPVRLHDARRSRDRERARGRNAGRLHHLLRERLRAFEPRRRCTRAEDRDPAMAQIVGEPGDERRFGADDDEVDAKLGRERDERRRVVRAGGVAGRERRNPGIPRRRMQLGQPAAARERPRERVLASARPHNEHLHGSDPRGRVSSATWKLRRTPQPAVEVLRLPGRTERARPGRRRGAARDPHRRPSCRGDDADAGARRGARARLLPLGGPAAAQRVPARRSRGEHRRCRRAGLRRGAPPAQLLHLVVVRRLRQGRARGGCRRGAARRVAAATCRSRSSSQLPDRLREAQAAFAATGGLHATGLFAADGELLCAREDVGRHNALDKVIGWAFGAGRLPLADAVLCVSGRLSFELVQKAAVAGCPVLVAVGAPSSLAVSLARRSRDHALRLRPRRQRQRLHRGVADRALTGVLLVGGASTRFGSPKALAAVDGETLAERAWRLLGDACDERIAVGKRRTRSSFRSTCSTTAATCARRSQASSPDCARQRTTSRS